MSIDPHQYDIRCSDSMWDAMLFRLEHWLLSPNSTPTGRLRGYLRLKEWRDCRTTGQRLHALKVAMKLPARALREAREALAEHGERVECQDGVPRARQLMHLWWIRLRYGARPSIYYAFRLHRPGQLGRASAFWQDREGDRFNRLLSVRESREEAEILLDKARLERWLVERKLGTVRTLLELRDGEIVQSSLGPDGLPRANLFSKPNDALQGEGTQRWRYDGNGWHGANGRRSGDELIEELRTQSRRDGSILVQEQLRNHHALAPLAPAALSTIRVLTLRELDGVVRVLAAVCKLPTGESNTDHMRYGGVAAPVDLRTGQLLQAIGKSKVAFTEPRELHPDTGTRLEGFQLPHWDQVLRLATNAHESFDRMACIGWDIAILESGPVIIEGNDNPGHASTQLPTGIGIGEMPVAETLAERLKASFARGRRGSRKPDLSQPLLPGADLGRTIDGTPVRTL